MPNAVITHNAMIKDVMCHGWYGQIRIAFFTVVNWASGLRQHFHNDRRLILKHVRLRVRMADDRNIGVIETSLVGQTYPDLCIGVEHPAFVAAKLAKQCALHITSNHVMGVPSLDHGIHDSAEVFMFDRRFLLS